MQDKFRKDDMAVPRKKTPATTGTRTIENPVTGLLRVDDAERFWTGVNDLVFPRYERLGFDGLTAAEQVAHCIDWLVREVEAGGLRHFLRETSGNHTADTLAALRTIGADHTAEMMELATTIFPEEVPVDQDERLAIMEDFTGRERRILKDFDAGYFDNSEDLLKLLKAHMGKHVSEFHPG
ncbi:MAG: DUF4375 domain-containing protein [Gemmatimonadales bacterium]